MLQSVNATAKRRSTFDVSMHHPSLSIRKIANIRWEFKLSGCEWMRHECIQNARRHPRYIGAEELRKTLHANVDFFRGNSIVYQIDTILCKLLQVSRLRFRVERISATFEIAYVLNIKIYFKNLSSTYFHFLFNIKLNFIKHLE